MSAAPEIDAPPKRLSALLRDVRVTRRAGGDAVVMGVEYDSRRVGTGSLFVAMRGGTSDGSRFIGRALSQGSSVIVTDTSTYFDDYARGATPVVLVEHGRRALAEIAGAFYGHPDRSLGVSGVTGTNGKTTTAWLLDQLLQAAARKTVMVGTVAYRIGGRELAAPHTTPESRDLLALFAEGVAEGASEAVMEISSHALEQGRVWGLAVDTAIFTNLTQDHLDFHGTIEAYLRAKRRLFDGSSTQPPRHAVLNADDAACGELEAAARQAGAEVWTYGIEGGAYRAEEIAMTAAGTRYRLGTPFGTVTVTSRLLGRVNVYNLTAALAAAVTRGVALEDAAAAAQGLAPPPGRFEAVDCGQPFTVLVDYAHTGDALANVTVLARELVARDGGRVITLFGCGGDRDRGKRPLMGRAAAEGSDVVVVTSDNPRGEEPQAIIAEILSGIPAGTVCVVEPDRARAIACAIEEARPGDLVLIAGKGHEKTQTIGTRVLPFDDVRQAAAVLRGMDAREVGR